MTLLDVIDLYKIFTVNLCEETNFLSDGRKWARLWFGNLRKSKLKKNVKKSQKRKLFNMMVPNFL